MKERVIEFVKSEKLTLIGVASGILGGFLYWRFIGCASGACPITANPYSSMLYGALMGGLILSIFKKK